MVSSFLRAPSSSTRSSKLFALLAAPCFDLLFSSNILPRSKISCLTLRRRSAASRSSSSRVEASGDVSPDFSLESLLDSESGASSSPRLCKAMATLRLDSSIHCRTCGFSYAARPAAHSNEIVMIRPRRSQ